MLEFPSAPYEPGEITAVAYDTEGREIARQSRHSFGESRRLVVETDKKMIAGDGEDLCFLTISTVDEDGYPVENAMNYITLSLEGGPAVCSRPPAHWCRAAGTQVSLIFPDWQVPDSVPPL